MPCLQVVSSSMLIPYLFHILHLVHSLHSLIFFLLSFCFLAYLRHETNLNPTPLCMINFPIPEICLQSNIWMNIVTKFEYKIYCQIYTRNKRTLQHEHCKHHLVTHNRDKSMETRLLYTHAWQSLGLFGDLDRSRVFLYDIIIDKKDNALFWK